LRPNAVCCAVLALSSLGGLGASTPARAAVTLTAKVDGREVSLSWPARRGATRFEVARKTTRGWMVLGHTRGRRYRDHFAPLGRIGYRVWPLRTGRLGRPWKTTAVVAIRLSAPIQAQGAPAIAAPPRPTIAPADPAPHATTTTTDTTPPAPAPSDEPFFDDFDGPAGSPPDPAKWTDYGFGCGSLTPQWGKLKCGATETLDGAGHLQVYAENAWGSALQTRGLYTFTHGTMSARIKMPHEGGYWAGFWALNGDQQAGEPPTGEVDAVEVYTEYPGVNSAAHVWTGPLDTPATHLLDWDAGPFRTDVDLSSDYHVYSATIAPDAITFTFDGVETARLNRSDATAWAFDRPSWLILNLAVGRGGQAPPLHHDNMLVDWVRVVPGET